VPAAIATLRIGIVDGEAAAHLGLNVVDGRPFQAGRYLFVHQELHATLIEDLVRLARSIVKPHTIMDFAATALALYEDTNAGLQHVLASHYLFELLSSSLCNR